MISFNLRLRLLIDLASQGAFDLFNKLHLGYLIFEFVGVEQVAHEVVGVAELQIVFRDITASVGLGASLRRVIAPLLLLQVVHQFAEGTALILIILLYIPIHEGRFEATRLIKLNVKSASNSGMPLPCGAFWLVLPRQALLEVLVCFLVRQVLSFFIGTTRLLMTAL